MAARKSCTHLTWSEAKAKVGGGGDSAATKKKSEPKKLTHVEKILAKNGASSKEQQQHKTALRKQYKQELRAAAAAKRREEERQKAAKQQLLVQKPYQQAKSRLQELATLVAQKDNNNNNNIDANVGEEEWNNVAQCKEMQLDELAAVEAMYGLEEGVFMLHSGIDLEELRENIEEWQSDQDNHDLLRAVVEYPPISFTLQLDIEDCCPAATTTAADDGTTTTTSKNLRAQLLLHVVFPPLYPLVSCAPPVFDILDFYVTDPEEVCNADKALRSLAHCDQTKVIQDMEQQAREELLPDPCIYELTTTWLADHLKDYVTVMGHLQ
mmetsp:Transcript_3869/g.5773  ORF Transcript_3869/g.5773 Transcript_3869/m.5773 type:complete len:324 (+) Transcript_3869:346-1317(+)